MPNVKCVAWTGLLRESLTDDVTNYRTAVRRIDNAGVEERIVGAGGEIDGYFKRQVLLLRNRTDCHG